MHEPQPTGGPIAATDGPPTVSLADRTGDAAGGSGLWAPGRRELTVGLVSTITLVAFEALAVSTIMPLVARDLGGLGLYGWVFTAFFLGSILGTTIAGVVIDERGLVGPLIMGLLLFAAGLLAGGLAPSMAVLVGARFVQGLGGGAVPPIAYVAIGRGLPERLRPAMFATLSTAWVLPGIAGPALAGGVAELWSWRWVFLGLLPLIGVSGLLAVQALARHELEAVGPVADARAAAGGPESTNHADGRDGRAGRGRLPFALLAVVGAAIVNAGLTSADAVAVGGLTVVGLALLVPAFRRLTPEGTLRLARGYPAAVLLRGALTFAFFAVDAYVSLALIEVRGLSAAEAGVTLTSATLSWTFGSWIQARLARRLGPERLAMTGFAFVAAGIVLTTIVLSPAVPVWFAAPAFAVAGLGMGLSYSQFAIIVLRDAPIESHGAATSGLTLSDLLGTALGTGVAGAIIAAAPRVGWSLAGGLATAFGVGSALAILGLVLSRRLWPRRGPVRHAPGPSLAA